MNGKRILLVISGGIAAYKSLDLIRRLKEQGAGVRVILTHGGAQFVTPLAVAAVSGEKVYQDLWSLTDESEMGHIRLSREADLVVVAPATAHILARMAQGLADDLATTALLATDKPVLVAPAMNTRMWQHPATQANMAVLERRGVRRVGPDSGDLACGETGPGRMSAIPDLLAAIATALAVGVETAVEAEAGVGVGVGVAAVPGPLVGRHALVTSGPTHEPIDPVRYIANRSSGRQGHAIAAALARLGARVTLVSGPVHLPDPPGVRVVAIETAREMLAACQAALPADIAVCAAAVADWRVADAAPGKLKKAQGQPPPPLVLTENPDILATLAMAGPQRPTLVIGFAAETGNTGDLVAHARDKRLRKGCDWIIANDVSTGTTTFGGSDNTVHLLRDDAPDSCESWPTLSKEAVADRLAAAIATWCAARRPAVMWPPAAPASALPVSALPAPVLPVSALPASVTVPVRRLPHGADLPLPAYATPQAAGLDLLAAVSEPVILSPGMRARLPTGLTLALPTGYEAQVRPRSGLALRHGVTVLNSPGTIDADYRGEVGVILINHGTEPVTICRGDRLAQLVIAPVARIVWTLADTLPETTRGSGGFGSTGHAPPLSSSPPSP